MGCQSFGTTRHENLNEPPPFGATQNCVTPPSRIKKKCSDPPMEMHLANDVCLKWYCFNAGIVNI